MLLTTLPTVLEEEHIVTAGLMLSWLVIASEAIKHSITTGGFSAYGGIQAQPCPRTLSLELYGLWEVEGPGPYESSDRRTTKLLWDKPPFLLINKHIPEAIHYTLVCQEIYFYISYIHAAIRNCCLQK